MSPLTSATTVAQRLTLRRRALDGAVVLAITIVIGLISQRWTGLDTPDSSFYLTLGLHGSAITDRVAEPYYAWTRLGAILPMRALTTLFGTFPGLEVYRLLLMLACVTGAFLTLRRFTGRTWSTLLTTMIMLSTVVLSYLGNPYLTRSVLAGTFLIIAIAAVTYVNAGRLRLPTQRAAATGGALAGIVIGWLVMTNPYGAILAGLIWLSLLLAATLKQRQLLRQLPSTLLTGLLTSLITWGLFIAAGRAAFPRLNWLQTYLDWNARLTYSDFASPEPVWLADISLLVPVAILITTTILCVFKRKSLPAQLGFLLSVATIALTFALVPLMGGITLEAPMYQAMLWPPLLLAAACSSLAVAGKPPLTLPVLLAAVLAILAVALAGRFPGVLSPFTGILLAVVMVVACSVLWLWGAASARSPATSAIAAVAGLAVLLAGSQLLQNSRRDIGLYYLSPYANAYLPNAIEAKVRTAVNAQDFVLANTNPDDQIQLWVGGDWAGGDRELYVVAGMQMWGPNIATIDPILDPAKAADLSRTQPSVIEMVAPSMPQVLEFWASLPPEANANAPNCYDFTWPDETIKTGHLCLARLSWSQPQ